MDTKELSRRAFLRDAGLGVAVGLVGSPVAAAGSRMLAENQIGLQLFTLAKEMTADWRKTLKAVAEIGYKQIEHGVSVGDSREAFLALRNEVGLASLSGGGTMAELRKGVDEVIAAAQVFGWKYVVCFWPWEDAGKDKAIDDWRAVADKLNALGEKVTKAGLVFAYHNHDIEFRPTGGRLPYDVLLEGTRPALVSMQIDLYWIEKGGHKATPFFEKHPGRFPIWHVKDMDATPERSFACVGEGVLDFPAIFAKADLAGMKHVVVEHDKPADGVACARTSLHSLRKLRY
jgi:sugar phosphate isomerase/epimerase